MEGDLYGGFAWRGRPPQVFRKNPYRYLRRPLSDIKVDLPPIQSTWAYGQYEVGTHPTGYIFPEL